MKFEQARKRVETILNSTEDRESATRQLALEIVSAALTAERQASERLVKESLAAVRKKPLRNVHGTIIDTLGL